MQHPIPEALAKRLRADFPADFLTTEPTELIEYGRDWTRLYPPSPCAVAWPRSTEEVARLMRLCFEHRQPVVPSGGRTGLAAGAVAANGELVLSLERMRALGEVDVMAQCVRVQAGAVTEAVHQHAAPFGLGWPIDFSAKGQSQVGGNIATNAGGVKVIRYGLTRQWVLGLQVVTAAGEVLELNGALEKNNTGFDLRQLFIGTEGTLGIITEATLKLVRLPRRLDVGLFAASSLAAVLQLFRALRATDFVIAAYELIDAASLAHVLSHRKVPAPLESASPYYVLMELEDADVGALETWLASMFERGLIEDGALAQSQSQAAALWALREGIGESLAREHLPHKNDIALPLANLEGFTTELCALMAARYPDFEVCLFGHIGDGNLHVNVMKPPALDPADFHKKTREVDHAVFTLVRKWSGSISAEHGIGLLKKAYLPYSRTDAELDLLRAMKRALDPRGILNPGKILDAED